MNCKFFSKHLFAYHEGTLPEAFRPSFEEHLISCDSCMKLNTRYNILDELIEGEKSVESSPFASTRILQRITEEFEPSRAIHAQVWVRVIQPVAIAIALVVGILIGLFTARTGNTQAPQLVNKTDHIQFLKSDLYISEFTDEDKVLDLNK
ncbi:MAG: zf-HC2 domain-containing protein [Bacteroidota bacterium]